MRTRKRNMDTILSYIQKHGSITVDICRMKLGIRRCSARIKDLRYANVNIISTMIHTTGGDKYAIYTIGAKK